SREPDPSSSSLAGRGRERLSGTFLQRVIAVDGEIRPRFVLTVGPANFDTLDRPRLTEPEVHTQIVLRVVAAAAAHLLPLHTLARHQANARADGVTVRTGSDQLQRNPVSLSRSIESKQVRKIVDVVDDDVEVAVVVEVGECRAASRLGR